MSSLAETHHPLSFIELAGSDPLLSLVRDLPLRRNYENSSSSLSYLEPPACEDVVFGPFDETAAAEINGVDSPGGRPICVFKDSLCNVRFGVYKDRGSNPQKEGETFNSLVLGANTYLTDLITTRTNFPEFNGTEFSVWRRFRDVVTLLDRLAEGYRGFFIPPQADKNVVESQVMQNQEFVEQRRVALEKYLRRLMAHPVIRKSDELRAFLQAQGKLPLPATTDMASRMLDGAVRIPKQLLGESTIQVADVGQPAKGGRDLLRMFKELKQSVANDWGGPKPSVVEEDKEFLEKKERMNDWEQQLNNASQQDTLHEYLGLMLSVHGAFADRSSALLTVQTLLSDLTSLHLRAEKLEVALSNIFGGDKSRIRKIEELKETINATEAAKNVAIREYEQIKEHNKTELERLERERQADFLNMLKGFVLNQVGYAEKIANVWAKVADEMSGYVKEST